MGPILIINWAWWDWEGLELESNWIYLPVDKDYGYGWVRYFNAKCQVSIMKNEVG